MLACLYFFFLMIRRPPRSTRLTHSFPTRRASDLHYVQPGVGHYGVFNGTRWRTEIQPRVRDMIRTTAFERGRVRPGRTARRAATQSSGALLLLRPLGGPVAPHAGRQEVPHDPRAASLREAAAREEAARDRRGWAPG